MGVVSFPQDLAAATLGGRFLSQGSVLGARGARSTTLRGYLEGLCSPCRDAFSGASSLYFPALVPHKLGQAASRQAWPLHRSSGEV